MLDYALRHLSVLLRKTQKPLAEELFSSGVSHKILPLPTDYDYNLHVNQAKYFQYGELVRFSLLKGSGVLKQMLTETIKPMVLAQKATYRREIKLGKPLTILTSIVGYDDKSFFFRHTITRNGRVYSVLFARAALWKKDHFLAPEDFFKRMGFKEADYAHIGASQVDDWVSMEARVLHEIKQAG